MYIIIQDQDIYVVIYKTKSISKLYRLIILIVTFFDIRKNF